MSCEIAAVLAGSAGFTYQQRITIHTCERGRCWNAFVIVAAVVAATILAVTRPAACGVVGMEHLEASSVVLKSVLNARHLLTNILAGLPEECHALHNAMRGASVSQVQQGARWMRTSRRPRCSLHNQPDVDFCSS